MRILAFDTSTRLCSVALSTGDEIWAQREPADRRQGERLLPMIEALLAEAGLDRRDLDLIAFGRGPGAFTGVRISVAVAQGLGLGLPCPLLPVSGLLALAEQAWRCHGQGAVLSALDARMGELYAAAYRRTPGEASAPAWTPVMPECLSTAARLALPATGEWYGMGSGFAACPSELAHALSGRLRGHSAMAEPLAVDILTLARQSPKTAWCAPAAALPVYLRDEVADPTAWRGPPRSAGSSW